MNSYDCANGDHDNCFRAPDHPVVLALNIATCDCSCHLKRQPDYDDTSKNAPQAATDESLADDPTDAGAAAARVGRGQPDQ